MGRMLVLAPLLAASCSIIGVYASYYLDVAPGGAVVLANAALFAMAYLLAPQRGVLWRLRSSRRRATVATST